MSGVAPLLNRIPNTRFVLEGVVADYLTAVSDNWLKIAPFSNPGMLEMFRDRDRLPRRNLLRWAGWFAPMHLISSVQMLRVSGNPELRKHIEWFVGELLALQDEDGYLGPWPQGYRLRNCAPNVVGHDGLCWDTSSHYYAMLGLIFWHEDTGDGAALSAARRIGDALCRVYLGNVEHRLVDTGYAEMNLAPAHSLVLLYRITSEDRYLQLARQIVDQEFAATADGGEHLAGNYLEAGLQGQEFFTLPKPRWESLHPMMAMVELYYVTGDDRYRKSFEHFWWSIVRTDRHNNGGFTTGEKAVGSPYAHGAIESCCTLAWMAYSVEMLRLTGSSVVADELELSTLNSVVGMHSHTGRWSTYSTPMDGVRRASTHDISFQAREGTPELNCCSVNTPRGFGMISDWAVMKSADGVVLNYYGPGSVDVELGNDGRQSGGADEHAGTRLRLSQETDYPGSGRITLRVSPSEPTEFEFKLRIPYWSRETTITLHAGASTSPEGWKPEAGSYLPIKRQWMDGDLLEIELDMSFHFWVGEEACAGKTSIYRGPILLAYDRRFNDLDPDQLPALDARTMTGTLVESGTWIEPMLLLEFPTDAGPVQLCDFGSAGEGGSPYRSWLSVENVTPGEFATSNPLRSARPTL